MGACWAAGWLICHFSNGVEPLVGPLVGWLVVGPLVGCSVGWLVGALVGPPVGWLVGPLVGPLVGLLVGWLVDPLVGWLVGLVGPLVGWLVGLLVGCTFSVGWLVGPLVGLLVGLQLVKRASCPWSMSPFFKSLAISFSNIALSTLPSLGHFSFLRWRRLSSAGESHTLIHIAFSRDRVSLLRHRESPRHARKIDKR